MKKVLIATTNKDKYSAVSKLFKNSIFKENEYIIHSLKDITKTIKESPETGDNVNRARIKALDAYDSLKDLDYDYIVGTDDALFIKGKIDPNIKLNLQKILYEDYLEDGEEYGFERAYCIIAKDKTMYETKALIPYIYHPCKNAKIEEFSYPLSIVSYPIGYDLPINQMDEETEINYYLKYVKEKLEQLNIK